MTGVQTCALPIFLDERDIKAGDSIPTKIYKAMETATHVIYVISENSKKSKWVEEELSVAKMREKSQCGLKIIPALIERAALPIAVAHIKYADFINWMEPHNFYNGLREVFTSIGVEVVTPTSSDVTFYCANYSFLNTLQSELTEYCGYVRAANLSYVMNPECTDWLLWKEYAESEVDARPDRLSKEFIVLCEASGMKDGSTKVGCALMIAKNLLQLLPHSRYSAEASEIYRATISFVSALDEIRIEMIGIFLAKLSPRPIDSLSMRSTYVSRPRAPWNQQVKDLKASRNLVEAIRLTREATGMEIRQAKEFVEAIWKSD